MYSWGRRKICYPVPLGYSVACCTIRQQHANERRHHRCPSRLQVGPIFGFAAGVAWKSFETMSQISFRNQCLVMTDWLRTKIFGRDISRV